MDFEPINEWIVIEEEAPVTQTASGLYIPKRVSEKQEVRRCKVLAISEDVPRIAKENDKELRYKVGDTVMHHSKIGLKIDVSNENDRRYLLRYDTVIAICEEKKDE